MLSDGIEPRKVMVEAECISKKYLINEQGSWYTSLRETMMEGIKSFGKNLFAHSSSFAKQTSEFWALEGVSFQVREGDSVGILGRNGAGKSTLLKILSGVTFPTTGRISLGGKVASLLEAGVGFHAELTARENIYFNGSLLGMKRREIEKNFDSIVAFSGVSHFLDTPMKKFSSGMSQRLGFAIGAHLCSDIFLVDEALAFGDANFQKQCIEKMKELVREGKTLFFVSHDLNALLSLCTQGLLLEKGRLLFSGPIEECASRYLAHSATKGCVWRGILGNSSLCITYASIACLEPVEREFFLPSDQAIISFCCEIAEARSDWILSLRIINAQKRTVAESRWCDSIVFESIVLREGKKVVQFSFSLSLFHPGEYFVVLDGGIAKKSPLFQDETILRFLVCSTSQQEHLGTLEGGISLGNTWGVESSSTQIEKGVEDSTGQREEIGVGASR